jgi:hypothetical protein
MYAIFLNDFKSSASTSETDQKACSTAFGYQLQPSRPSSTLAWSLELSEGIYANDLQFLVDLLDIVPGQRPKC